MNRNTVKIDATGQSLGRLASQVAKILMGKNKATYVPHIDGGDAVEVSNVIKLKIPAKKMTDKLYYHHTGRPGSLQTRTLGEIWEKNPAAVLEIAVKNMMPKNKLHVGRMKRLSVK
ncbi:MAG: 50S ribosomal protein L13 [Patescibacteria group bacterium]